MEEASESYLVCFDSDNTIIDGHTHNTIQAAIDKDPSIENDHEAQWNLVKNMPPVGTAEDWKSLFATLLDDGHRMAIVSFSRFGNHIIPRYLNEIIGIEANFIEQHIPIISFLPKNQSNKHPHMEQAKEKTQMTHIPNCRVILIDDRGEIISNARKVGYQTIIATNDGTHIQVMKTRSNSIKHPKIIDENSHSSSESLKVSGIFNSSSRSPSPSPATDEREILKGSFENLKLN